MSAYPGQGYGPGAGHYDGYPQQQQRRYPPPQRPPPEGYDMYGYPISRGPGPEHGGAGAESAAAPPPPSGLQQFGHGAPREYTFQYSNCTGRRRALLIGINYFGQNGELRGCINDVRNVSAFLIERHGYRREDMVILTDDQENPIMQPTRENIINAMQWLVRDARPNDALFLHFSGGFHDARPCPP